MPVCPNCGKNTPIGKFCEHCGAPLPQFLPEPVIQVPQPVAAPPQEKKGSVFVKILIVIVIILGLFFAIGIYAIYTGGNIYPIDPYPIYPTTTPTWHLPSEYETQLTEASYEYQEFALAKGEKVKVAVSTDGAPIDLLIMDSSNFNVYENTNPTPETVRYAGLKNIIKDEYTFVAPQYDTYYFVFDNSYWPKSGSNAKKNVWITAVYTEYY